jgi:biotin-(acetyl-CoA carboxylase) ligase
VKGPSVRNDSGSKDCVNLPLPTALFRFKDRIGVVLGWGLNVNMSQQALESIDQPATSLAQVSGKRLELEPLLESIVAQFLQDLSQLEKKGFVSFRAAYEQHLEFKGKYIRCSQGEKTIFGYAEAVDDQGHLLLRLEDGSVLPLSSGEVQMG